jgi:hypothetical protein
MNEFEKFMIINENKSLKKEIENLENIIKGYENSKCDESNEEVEGIECAYDYDTSKEFENQLKEIRRKQKVLIKNKEAIIHDMEWTVQGSEAKGNKLMKDISNLALMSFNDYCDTLIIKLKYSGIDKVKDNITNKYNKINKLLKSFCTRISVDLLKLKFMEADLRCGWLRKKEEEKEEIRRKEAEIREQLKLEEEINKAKEKIQYEQAQYNTEIVRLQEQLINEQGNNKVIKKQLAKLQDKIAKLEEKKKDVLNRQINKKAGWVYIISNDSFKGKEVYKVGTTRRLDPLNRVAELSSASVPFKFKVHSIIFSEDCYDLETTLHKALDDKRWNLANKHKEFFVCSLNEIKEEVLKHNPTATFIDNPTDDEYEITQQLSKKVI